MPACASTCAGWDTEPSQHGPVTACKSIASISLLPARLAGCGSTVSSLRTRRNGPGTMPSTVQCVKAVPLAGCPSSSTAFNRTDASLAGDH